MGAGTATGVDTDMGADVGADAGAGMGTGADTGGGVGTGVNESVVGDGGIIPIPWEIHHGVNGLYAQVAMATHCIQIAEKTECLALLDIPAIFNTLNQQQNQCLRPTSPKLHSQAPI